MEMVGAERGLQRMGFKVISVRSWKEYDFQDHKELGNLDGIYSIRKGLVVLQNELFEKYKIPVWTEYWFKEYINRNFEMRKFYRVLCDQVPIRLVAGTEKHDEIVYNFFISYVQWKSDLAP